MPDLGTGDVAPHVDEKSVDLRNWEAAQKLVREWESGNAVATKTMEGACDPFLKDCEVRGLSKETLGKYGRLMKGLKGVFKGVRVGNNPCGGTSGVARGVEGRCHYLTEKTATPPDIFKGLPGIRMGTDESGYVTKSADRQIDPHVALRGFRDGKDFVGG
jgi:hypothetical protein